MRTRNLCAMIVALLLCTSTGFHAHAGERATAVFAGGCFWCMQPPFDELEGVLSTTVGYTGGDLEAPSYEQVTAGETGHLEAVRVTYDPKRIGYPELLEVFWRNVDPLDDGGQFCDRGNHYRSAIFHGSERERELAEESKRALEESGRFEQQVVTGIRERGAFYEAEDYHQNYYRKNPLRYRFYVTRCGRKERLEELWP